MDGEKYEQSTLYPERVPAVAVPGTEEAAQATVASGLKCYGLSKSAGALGLLERTLLGSHTWSSTLCHLRWKARATPQGRLYDQLVPSVPRVDGAAPKFVLTPMASDCGRMRITEGAKKYNRNSMQHRLALQGYIGTVNVAWIEWLMGYPQGWTIPGSSPPEAS